MKKLLVLFAVMAMVATTGVAQFKYGGGLTLGTKMAIDESGEKMGFGINIRGDYAFNDKLSLAPGFTFILPSSADVTVPGFGSWEAKFSAWQLNADVHYILTGDESFSIYGLGGLVLKNGTAKVEGISNSESEIGLNLGAGANFGGMFFGELKYDTTFEQIGITVGVLF